MWWHRASRRPPFAISKAHASASGAPAPTSLDQDADVAGPTEARAHHGFGLAGRPRREGAFDLADVEGRRRQHVEIERPPGERGEGRREHGAALARGDRRGQRTVDLAQPGEVGQGADLGGLVEEQGHRPSAGPIERGPECHDRAHRLGMLRPPGVDEPPDLRGLGKPVAEAAGGQGVEGRAHEAIGRRRRAHEVEVDGRPAVAFERSAPGPGGAWSCRRRAGRSGGRAGPLRQAARTLCSRSGRGTRAALTGRGAGSSPRAPGPRPSRARSPRPRGA